jgi:hypothetical protein
MHVRSHPGLRHAQVFVGISARHFALLCDARRTGEAWPAYGELVRSTSLRHQASPSAHRRGEW